MEGKLMKKRCIKIPEHIKKRKKPCEKGDEKDKDIYRERCKMRVVWTSKEDSVLLMCRLATLIMDNKKKTALISYVRIRDYLHEKCGAVSNDKTSQAVQRRIKFVLKNPQTETNLLLYYREAMQDEFVLTNYVSKEFILTEPDLEPKFRRLVEYLLDKFKSLDLQKCSLPDNLDDLRQNYTIQYIGKLQPRKVYSDVKSKADICQDVLRNILHSAVLLQDKQGRTHEMFKLLSQYPDALLSAVVRELRSDGLFVINKKNYQHESVTQLQTGMGLRNFKVSQRYLFQYKHKYLSAMFEESAKLLTEMCDNHLHGNEEDEMLTLSFHPKSGESAMLLPLILNRWLDIKITMPQELVIVDMEGFYKFPWGRGKNSSSQTKGDKMLQDIKMPQTHKDKRSGARSEGSETDIGGKVRRERESRTNLDKEEQVPTENSGRAMETAEDIEDENRKTKGSGKLLGKDSIERTDSKETSNKTIEKGKEEMSNECTHISTNHSTVVVPDWDLPEQTGELPGTIAGIASRTLLSLRRAEDCSFDEIRIFNAQDYFVVNSCEIGIKIRDNLEEGKSGNPTVKKVAKDKSKDSNKEEKGMDKNIENATVKDDENAEKANSEEEEMSLKEKMKRVSQLLLDKGKIRNIYTELQRLLPFQINMEQVWTSFKEQATSEDDLKLYKNVFYAIDSHGEIGVRSYDLKKQFEDGYPWREAVDVLVHQNAVVKVGVTCTRFVSLNNARPWVIHAYRNIRGRGMHVDEDTESSIRIEQVDESHPRTSLQDREPYLYTEPADVKTASSEVAGTDKIRKNQEKAENSSKKCTGEISPKKRKFDTESEPDPDNEEQKVGPDKTDTSEGIISVKRKLSIESQRETDIEAKKRKPEPFIEGDKKTANENAGSDKNRTEIDNKTEEAIDKQCKEIETDPANVRDESVDNVNSNTDGRKDVTNSSEVTEAEKEKTNSDIATKGDSDVATKGESDASMKGDSDVATKGESDASTKGDGDSAVIGDKTNEESMDQMQTRKLRKRKLPEEAEENQNDEAPAVSTYDKVRLIIQPWRKPEGGINKPILKMMLESVLLFIMMNPGSPEDALVKRYAPYLQPMILRNIVDVLEDIGCVTREFISKTKSTLFSKPSIPTIGGEENEDSIALMVPAEDCVLKMGLFGQEVFPFAKWPENTYPQKKPF
ncbi:uncharacterized protein LOC128547945 [Mercenaria mercenaria]|uniref:uncharacterized protein LOC128547945 n=1 Tax=Mercenaria mercenaria TaxID=6596 RepID=UPI00234E92B7|nr:uncharacterized protein LOC128547945 [Mercenaria mercenaria]